jgi:hypothetical protein
MASESIEDGSLTVTLPSDLGEWLDDRARQLGVDREAVLLQLLASYRVAAELDGDPDGTLPVEDAVDQVLEDRIAETTGAVREQLTERIDAVEADYAAKLDDVRDRVVQVKKETDGKAPRDHDHPEFGRVDTLADRLGDLSDRLDDLERSVEDVHATVAERDDVEGIADRLEETQDRLQTVAWAVSDLREDAESRGRAVERIKHAAAKADIDRARCEHCGNGVDIALLTAPECPHCQTTVTDVEPADGFFTKPQLLAASQLESGTEP